METNNFLYEPIIVSFLSTDLYPTNQIVYIGAVPNQIKNAIKNNDAKSIALLKSWYGSDYANKLLLNHTVSGSGAADNIDKTDFNEDDIMKLLNNDSITTSKTTVNQIEYNTDVPIYPEDNFAELKDKIYLSSGIPPYRQHLFYFENNQLKTTYSISNPSNYLPAIQDLETCEYKIAGIPIDTELYSRRDNIKIKASDTLQIIAHLANKKLFVLDIALFINQSKSQIIEIISDAYQFDLVYYGFVIKYWPQLTKECFYDYISNEHEMTIKYPDLAPARSTLETKYKIQSEIINYQYKNSKQIDHINDGRTITMSITQMIAYVNNENIVINIRNLFDKLRTTRIIPEIHAYVEYDSKKYLLRKTYAKNGSDIQFPAGQIMKNGITLAISLKKSDQLSFHNKNAASTIENIHSRYMFLNIWPNGKYYIRSVWNEEDEFTFEDIVKIAKRFIDPIISGINDLGRYVFANGNSLALIQNTSLKYHSLNVSIYWKRVMMNAAYKLVKLEWDDYLKAGIVAHRQSTNDKFELLFKKGMYEFDTSSIEKIMIASGAGNVFNQYMYLSNAAIKQKWDQNYTGRILKLLHRTTDVKFEILDIGESEYYIFYQYICGFVYRLSTSLEFKTMLIKPTDWQGVKKLRKMREQDPELFNLKKFGSKKVYSIECQNPRQPLIYTDDEVNGMTKSETSKLTKYWNFTLQRPAFYGCPNKKYPHLGFIVGKHPRGYCLPCCNKKARTIQDSKKARINQICLKNHCYNTNDTENTISRHVVHYGKDIDIGRLSQIPTGSIKMLLENTITNTDTDNENYYLYGCCQHNPGISHIGVLYAAAIVLNTTSTAIATNVFNKITNDSSSFHTLLNGTIHLYFQTHKDLAQAINELFVLHKQFTIELRRFDRWSELWTEFLYKYYDLFTIVWIDKGSGGPFDLYLPEYTRSQLYSTTGQYMILFKRQNKYYPMCILNPDVYFKDNKISQKIYYNNSPIIDLIKSISKNASRDLHENTITISKLLQLVSLPNSPYTIKTLYINAQNLCWLACITFQNRLLFTPVNYSLHYNTNLPLKFTTPLLSEYTALCDDITQFLTAIIQVGIKLKPTNIMFIKNQFVGILVDKNLYYYCNEPCNLELSKIHLACDYRVINNLISTNSKPQEDDRSKMLGAALYHNHIYQLLVLEFINYLDKEVNTELRTLIIDLIAKINIKNHNSTEFDNQLYKIVEAFPNDYVTLISQINQIFNYLKTKKMVISEVENTIYEFDKITLTKLIAMSPDQTKIELTEIFKHLVVYKDLDTSTIQFPNIYMPCSEQNESVGYCSAKKLIVAEPLQPYIDILSADIHNSLKIKYLACSSWLETVTNYFYFTKWPNEFISIFKLSI